MKNSSKITMMMTAIGAGAIAFYVIRKLNTKRMLSQVADEGYETAPDILFPGKKVNSNLHYGPVVPV